MMKTPPHPGFVIKNEVLAALALKVTDAAAKLGMSRVALQMKYDIARARMRGQPAIKKLRAA